MAEQPGVARAAEPVRAAHLPLALGLAATALTWATVSTAPGGPHRLAAHLTLFVLAGAAWLLLLLVLARWPRARGQAALWLTLALLQRAPAYLHAPAHSDDVYRYLWDGRVQRAGVNPYRHAPDAAELAPLRDDGWARVNNRQLPTVYPALAELSFALAARLPLSPLAAWRGLTAAADLATLLLLVGWLRRRGADERLAAAWGLCPLAAVELGMNAHVDGLGIALLVASLLLAERGRRATAGIFLGLAAAVKLVPILVAPAVARSRRAAFAALAALALVTLPYLGPDAPSPGGSLGEYSRRWRANDGAFALFHVAARAALRPTRFGERARPGPRLARLITGRDRDEVYPDEAANLLARLAALAGCLGAVGLALYAGLAPLAVAEVGLGGFLLVTPTLHPWYVLWILPLVAVGAHPAWALLATLAPLAYAPLAAFRATGQWLDPTWTRLVEHGLVWAWLASSLLRRHRRFSLTRRELRVT